MLTNALPKEAYDFIRLVLKARSDPQMTMTEVVEYRRLLKVAEDNPNRFAREIRWCLRVLDLDQRKFRAAQIHVRELVRTMAEFKKG